MASDPCNAPNVIPQPVCDFDNFNGAPPREMPDGWSPFVLAGDLEYARDEHSFFGGGTLRMRNSGGTFKAGIFTQVPVTPGAGYRASLSWGAPNAPDQFGRQLGIDPSGGTDPNAATVIWGPMHWGEGRILNYPPGQGPNIDVKARAVGDKVTVFFLVDHPVSTGDNLIFVDALALYPDESAPQRDPPTPTPEATPAPTQAPAEVSLVPVMAAEAAPISESAVEVLIPPTDTPAPTEVPTASATSTPTATPTSSPTATPSPTVTATWTPWPTSTPASIFSASGGGPGAVAATPSGVGLLAVSGLSFFGAILFGGSFMRTRRRR
jgi:hypothetical protein